MVTLRDAITKGELADFSAAVTDAIESDRGSVILDLAEVPYIDSAGLERLIELQQEYADRGGQIRLATPSEICHEALRITGLLPRFSVFNSIEEAARVTI